MEPKYSKVVSGSFDSLYRAMGMNQAHGMPYGQQQYKPRYESYSEWERRMQKEGLNRR